RTVGVEAEDLPAPVVGEDVRVVEGGRPDPGRHERTAGDGGAAVGVAVVEDGVGHAGRGRAAVGRRPGGAVALADVPPVVVTGEGEVDLVPSRLTDVVHVDPVVAGVAVDGEPEGVAQTPGEDLLALQ